MGVFFKVTNLLKDENPRFVKAPVGSQHLYDCIEEIVGDETCPASGVPYPVEVDGWGELAWVGQQFECKEFLVDCISEEEFDNARRYPNI